MFFAPSFTVLSFLSIATGTNAFIPTFSRGYSTASSTSLDAVGIFFGTSTGSTEEVAYAIQDALNDAGIADVKDPLPIDEVVDELGQMCDYSALIVGTPTWNTGADTERSGTAWDEIYYTDEGLDTLKNTLGGKKVAVFGLGDSVSYAENFADATGELHDKFKGLGCTMMGYTSTDGYVHKASKSILPNGKFCGLLCDAVNQGDMTEERVANWVNQLVSEGMFDSSTSSAQVVASELVEVMAEPVETIVPPTTTTNNVVGPWGAKLAGSAFNSSVQEQNETEQLLENHAKLLEEVAQIVTASSPISAVQTEFTPHYNPKIGSTMWTSADGKKCYFTKGSPIQP